MHKKTKPYLSRWIEINLNSISKNIYKIKRVLNPQTKFMAVLKAEAYGHGLKEVAKIAERAHVDYLGVSILEEGLTLRNAKIKTPILIFTPLLPDQYTPAIDNNLTLTICNVEGLEKLNKLAALKRKKIKLHLKIDSGLGRLGMYQQDIEKIIAEINSFANLKLEGIYTHLGYLYDTDINKIKMRFKNFETILNNLSAKKIYIPIKHAANSSALLDFSYMQLDMVRIGNLLYGFIPFSRREKYGLHLENPWIFKTRIIQIKNIPKNTHIGYGKEYSVKENIKTAVIPVGFFEGLSLSPISIKNNTQKLYVESGGYKLPIIGRISMQMAIIDITKAPELQIGDEVTITTRRTSTNSLIPRLYRKPKQ